jgi:hypothetical protein
MKAIALALNRPNPVVEVLDESECDFIVSVAIGLDSIPIGFDELGKFFER